MDEIIKFRVEFRVGKKRIDEIIKIGRQCSEIVG